MSGVPSIYDTGPEAEVVEQQPAIASSGGLPHKAPPPKAVQCRLRIIAVSDVYLLDNLPALKTLVAEESKGFPPENIVTVLPGDFLAPSLLSSLDAGYSMVKVLNHVPIQMVCFGNHDGNDIVHSKLCHRIEEFKGTWLNTNIPDFEPELPKSTVRSLTGVDGKPGARKVAFLGFCIGGGKYQAMYREEAFGGAHKTMIPVMESIREATEECFQEDPDLDEVIPLTHQDLAQDVEAAKMGLFPVILGGHDHDQSLEAHGENSCWVVKPGQDATHAGIIDVEWHSSERGAHPSVSVVFKAVKDFTPDPELAEICDKAYEPVRKLESATLYELPKGESLSSVDARYKDVSMARMLATSVRECLNCDAAIINSGTVRGNKEYNDCISYGDLKKECPFPSAVVTVMMPFAILREGVKVSRRPWWEALEEGKQRKECASALQVDDGMDIDDHAPTTILGRRPDDPDKLYSVACDTYVLRKNVVFKEYCARFPERVPPADCGRPLLPILVEHFCTGMWRQIIEAASGQCMSAESIRAFKDTAAKSSGGMLPTATEGRRFSHGVHKIFTVLDVDKDGLVKVSGLQTTVQAILGSRLSSEIVMEQMIQMVDEDADGMLSESDLNNAIRKLAPR